MMVGGIILVAGSPVAFLFAASGFAAHLSCTGGNDSCGGGEGEVYAYVGGLGGLLLLATGVPMIVIGSEKVPATGATTAIVVPWAGRSAVGATLRLEL